MTADLINLRRARKAKARSHAEAEAAENRIKFGRQKSQRHCEAATNALIERTFEAHRRETPEGDDDVDGR